MSFPYDGEGIDPNVNWTVAPEGVYTLQIDEATEKMTKNGDPMVTAKCHIANDKMYETSVIWHNVVFFLDKKKKGSGMSIHFLKTIGEPWEGQFDVDPDAWIGKQFKAKVLVTKDLQGRDRNAVGFVIRDEEAQEEVPF